MKGVQHEAAYVIAASVLGPALGKMGIQALVSHLFIFWFAIKSGLTPPVCIAVFTAAAIAGGNWLKFAWISIRLGIGGYIMPLFFVFYPVFLMQGHPIKILFSAISGIIAMFPLEASIMGHWLRHTTILERILFFIGGLAILHPSLLTEIFGLILIAIGFLSQKYQVQIPIIGIRSSCRY